MLEDVKEYLESFNCKANRCEKCENRDKCYGDDSPFSEYSPEEDLYTIEETEEVIKEVLEYMPRKLVVPGIYKHFKHTKDGIPNNYMYAVKFISNPISVDWINKEMEKDTNIVENTCYFEHTELKEKSVSFLINNKWYHSDEFSKDKLVVYCAMYNDHIDYARPYDMFIGEVDHEKYQDVKQKYRFELVRH